MIEYRTKEVKNKKGVTVLPSGVAELNPLNVDTIEDGFDGTSVVLMSGGNKIINIDEDRSSLSRRIYEALKQIKSQD